MNDCDNAAATELAAMKSAWRSLATRWGLTLDERQALLPAGGEGVAKPPADTERRMRILIEIGRGIGMRDDVEWTWLRTSSEVLGGIAPLTAMGRGLGDLRGVRRLVEEGLAA